MPGDGRKSQRGVSTDGRGGFWHSPRSCPEPLELVGLKFSWSPTRLYRRVERVGTTVEPLRLEARESQRGHGNQQNAGRVWGFDSEVGWEVIKVYVNYLCAKLNAGGRLNLIHTVRGVGYILKP